MDLPGLKLNRAAAHPIVYLFLGALTILNVDYFFKYCRKNNQQCYKAIRGTMVVLVMMNYLSND